VEIAKQKTTQTKQVWMSPVYGSYPEVLLLKHLQKNNNYLTGDQYLFAMKDILAFENIKSHQR
jgi:hypothetical protein